MINFVNKVCSFFVFGSISQTNTISINNTKLDTVLRMIERHFFKGEFREAIDNLDKLILENSSQSAISERYSLLILKSTFSIRFGKIDEARELVINIENQYSNFIDLKFKEIKLTLMAFDKDEYFFDTIRNIRSEVRNSKSEKYFEVRYYLGHRNFEKAKKIIESFEDNEKNEDDFSLIAGNIYSALFEESKYSNVEYFKKADRYYKQCLIDKDQLSFLDILNIKGFYALISINNHFQKRNFKEELFFSVKYYKKSLSIIVENKDCFDKNYVKLFLRNYAYTLIYLKKREQYINFYKDNKKLLSIMDYINYCDLSGKSISHKKIQSQINDKPKNEIISYCSFSLVHKDKNYIPNVVSFLQKREDILLSNEFFIYIYLKGCIILDKKITVKLAKYIKENKHKNYDTLLTFMEYCLFSNININDQDINRLLKLSGNEYHSHYNIICTIDLLKRLDRIKDIIDIAIKKQEVFSGIVNKTLNVIEEYEPFYYDDFEYFINKVNKKNLHYGRIGNLYIKYDQYEIAFDFHYRYWQQDVDNIKVMVSLLKIAHYYYKETYRNIDSIKQSHIYSLLVSNEVKLDWDILFYLLYYSIEVSKNVQQVLFLINKRLLESDIEKLDSNLKQNLSSIYFETDLNQGTFNKVFNCQENLCLIDNKNSYIKKDIYINFNKKNIKLGLSLIDDNQYFIKSKTYEKSSLFHRIVSFFAFSDNPNIKTIQVDPNKENPLESLYDFLDREVEHDKEIFNDYIHGTIGLLHLAENNYKNYFTLIPCLLNSNYPFNSLNIIVSGKEVPKILTLSSIIFLDKIGYLDTVLKQKDIFIQQTLINWLKLYSSENDIIDMPKIFHNLRNTRHEFISHTQDDIYKFKNNILKLIEKLLNCGIINDTSEKFPYKEINIKFKEILGLQEHKALAYSHNHGYQIISEDSSYDIFFDIFKTYRQDRKFISNSLVPLLSILEYKEFITLIKYLHSKKYKYVLSKENIDTLKNNNSPNNDEKELIKIAKSYQWI